jgi:hypothetical protein
MGAALISLILAKAGLLYQSELPCSHRLLRGISHFPLPHGHGINNGEYFFQIQNARLLMLGPAVFPDQNEADFAVLKSMTPGQRLAFRSGQGHVPRQACFLPERDQDQIPFLHSRSVGFQVLQHSFQRFPFGHIVEHDPVFPLQLAPLGKRIFCREVHKKENPENEDESKCFGGHYRKMLRQTRRASNLLCLQRQAKLITDPLFPKRTLCTEAYSGLLLVMKISSWLPLSLFAGLLGGAWFAPLQAEVKMLGVLPYNSQPSGTLFEGQDGFLYGVLSSTNTSNPGALGKR